MTQEVINNLMAQIEASKQMYNEALNSLYQVRVSNVMLQQQIHALKNQQEVEQKKEPEPEVPPEAKGEENATDQVTEQ